jgi:hypothetical protein
MYVIHTVNLINLWALVNICHSAIQKITKYSPKIFKSLFHTDPSIVSCSSV